MAREVVITSVPRGIRLGRTGFQMVMRTAGLRDDVCDQLESLAVYRHLPPGTGPNPVCFFHRMIQTGVGALSVLGRIVDAGADYSSRSNKLAHLVAIDQSEVAALRQSSPAAVLAAIEGRLATTWPGGPEERAVPFGLAAMPPIQPAVGATWQQVLGDAGWAGVLADRAIASRPVLVVAPDSSPAWCRRLLALFGEALMLVPPQKRWAVTFDTTILSATPVNWRGTYAGSPESSFQQPGLLVVDLRRRAPVPSDSATSALVAQARTGRVAVTGTGIGAPGGPPAIPGPPVPGGLVAGSPPDSFDGLAAIPPHAAMPEPPPPRPGSAREKRAARPPGHHQYPDPYADRWKMWVTLAVLTLLVLLAGGVYALFRFDVIGQVRLRWARAHLDAWAKQDDGSPPKDHFESPPTKAAWKLAYPTGDEKRGNDQVRSLDAKPLEDESLLALLNSSLLTAAVTPDTIKTCEQAQRLIDSCSRLISAKLQVADLAVIGATAPGGADAAQTRVVGWVNELLEQPERKQHPRAAVLPDLTDWVQRLSPLAGLCTAGSPTVSAKELLPGLTLALELKQSDTLEQFADSLITKKTPVKTDPTLADLREAFQGFSDPTPHPPIKKSADTAAQANQRESAWKGFVARFNQLAGSPRNATSVVAPVALATGIQDSDAIEWNKVEVVLPALGDTWSPRALRAAGEDGWIVSGLPDEAGKEWGTLRLTADGDTGQKQLVFQPMKDMPWYCGYVPIMLQHGDYPQERTNTVIVLTQPQQLRWTTDAEARVTLLALVAPDPGVNESPLPHFRIDWPSNHAIPQGRSLSWKVGPEIVTDTNAQRFSFGLIHNVMSSDGAGESQGTLYIRWIESNKSLEKQLTFEEDIATWALNTATMTVSFGRPRSLSSWTEARIRWKILDPKSGSDRDKELNWLGIRQTTGGKGAREFGYCGKDHWAELLVAIFEAGPGGKKNSKEVGALCDQHWHTPDPNKDKELSLLDWRRIVREYLRDSQIIESGFPEPKPEEPVRPTTGQDGEKDKEREAIWRQQHEDWQRKDAAWKERKASFVKDHLTDSRKLRGFLERRRDRLPLEQVRAVEVLAELDSLIVAKLRWAELKDELDKATLRDAIGRLELELVLPWAIAGEEKPMNVPAARVSGVKNDTAPEVQRPQ